MAEAFAVDPEGLADAVPRMAVFQQTLDGLLAEIDTVVRNLHGTWDGEAAGAHAVAHQYWTRGASTMRAALTTIHTAGGTVHGNYTSVSNTNSTMWAD